MSTSSTSTTNTGDGDNVDIESRQDSKANDTFDNCDGGASNGYDIAPTNKFHGEEDERVPTPKGVTTEELQLSAGAPLEPAFVLKDMDTIDHPQYKQYRAASPHHHSSQRHISTSVSPQRHHARSPSPPPGHGSVISRRGRSRSPVGLTPHHHRAGSNSRAPSTLTVQAGCAGQDELSSAALAAGEAAANNLAANYHHHRHHSTSNSNISDNDAEVPRFPACPQGMMGRRSPSPVSRFPSLTSQSFEISPQHSMRVEGMMGSFDWNVGTTLQPQQNSCFSSDGRGDGGRSPFPMDVPNPRPLSHQQNGGDQYYSSYPPSYPYSQPNEDHPTRNLHPRHPSQPTARVRSPSPTFRGEGVDHDKQHQRHYQVNHNYIHDHGNRHAPSNDPSESGGRHLIRRNSQQALFPEHHILSSHSKDRFENRPHHSTVPSSSACSSPTRGLGDGSTTKTKRGGSRGSGRLNNTESHRSSVFRGSPIDRGAGQRKRNVGDSLPQELLLALEEDEDIEDSTTHPHPHALADNSNAAIDRDSARDGPNNARSAASPSNTLVANLSMPGAVDPLQVDDCLLYDDYLSSNLSFRKSYDLGQVFSFIKEGSSGGGAHGQLSFNMGLSSESNEDVDNDRANRSNNGSRGGHALYGSQSMGLTPINSFSCDNNRQGSTPGIVPLNSMDGMALRAFFSSSPTTIGSPQLGNSLSPTGGSLVKISSPRAYDPTQSENAPVVHASTPPSYGRNGSDMRYGPTEVGNLGMISHCTYSNMETPPHGPSLGSYHNARNMSQSSMHPGLNSGSGVINMSFPSKRIKLSTKHSVYPIAMDLSRRSGGDDFVLLRKLAPCFANFRFKLPELESSADSTPSDVATRLASSGLLQAHLIIAKRRISSSICAFGGSLPTRVVSPSHESLLSLDGRSNIHGARPSPVKEETPDERDERLNYEQNLSGRYFMKETCISWDVELHEIISPPIGDGRRGQKKAGGGGRSILSEKRQIGVFKKGISPQTSSNYCAPVTPSSPGDDLDSSTGVVLTPGGDDPNPQSSQEKGTKIKYRCKLCGQPKQNHTCSYQSAMVRSIGTMVYPAVNAFVSNEPGRLAPALSEMNNFTSLLSQDTSAAGGTSQLGNMNSFGMAGPYRPPPPHRRGLYAGNVITPDACHWSPNTPGGLSTMSSSDPNSPGGSAVGTPGGITSNMTSARHHGGHNQTLMSRSMNYSMSMSLSGPPPQSISHTPSMPPAPAGAIPSDVLFRDTMELKREQFRTVGAVSATASSDGTCSGDSNAIIDSPHAFRYPHIPTPYSQRKELGDTLFAMSREVPSLSDSCAAILRDARENDEWDQAVAELTTQVLVVLKCEEQDYTLEGLRRHLLTLGIAC